MKVTPLFLFLAASAFAADTPAQKTTGAFFALSVADLKTSTQWYTDKLGLKSTLENPKRDGVAVIVLEGDVGGTKLIVELIRRDDAQPLAKATNGIADPIRVHGVFKAGVVVDDFDKTLATLKARQVEIAYGPYPARSNQRANVIVRDNAGNLLQFFGKYAASGN
ncbi:MAG TPA: VOC family protein [Bryobacteraceae bacterium]|jgi:catechol 2,3-dioxygenase-like lactoylglutathione lyase family enzyme|nr:VOC family protein [Bryobacteraceae bacterium]